MYGTAVNVVFYDGIVSKPFKAVLKRLDEHAVQIQYEDGMIRRRMYRYSDMTLIGALGQIHPVIELNDDARIEFSTPLPTWFELDKQKKSHAIWKLERSPSLILFSIVFVAAFIFALGKWGVPFASYQVATHLPANTLNKLGAQSEQYILEMTKPSQLPKARQNEIVSAYQKLFSDDQPAKILFRSGERIGANALAIPNNTIILTDELVNLTKNDAELLGVLAHEQGHLKERHSLQQLLASLGYSAIVILITGDSSNFLASVPISLIGLNYSRDFESQADQYALKTLHQHQIPVKHLANFLTRLSESQNEGSSQHKNSDFFSSHPATSERVQAVKDFEAKHPLPN